MAKAFILPAGHAELKIFLSQLLISANTLPKKKWEVTIKEYKHNRTTTKNNGYWGYTLTPAAEQLGYESVEKLHELVCCELYGIEEIEFAGKKYTRPIRTTTRPKVMTREEFDLHCERAAALLTDQGVQLPAQETWHA